MYLVIYHLWKRQLAADVILSLYLEAAKVECLDSESCYSPGAGGGGQ